MYMYIKKERENKAGENSEIPSYPGIDRKHQ